MADRPILYQGAMVRACLDGRKTQTRRIFKPQPVEHPTDGSCRVMGHMGPTDYLMREIAPKHWVKTKPGDRLWVRESWSVGPVYDKTAPRDINPGNVPNWCGIYYPATKKPIGCRIRPGIHMPRWASRLTQVVTEVRVQRLQDISEADAIAEGVPNVMEGGVGDEIYCPTCQGMGVHAALGAGYGVTEVECEACETAKQRYANLWDHINGPGAWAQNPWIVALSFTNHQRNIDALEAQKAAL